MNNDRFLAVIAKLYYIDKVKQNEIAKRFAISSMMVSRLLKEAEANGIVTFHVKMPWLMDTELGSKVAKKYGLQDCYAFDIPENDKIPHKLGSCLADYFTQILPKKNAIVGLSWGNTISKFVDALPYIQVENCSLVQLTGSFQSSNAVATTTDILNEVSKKIACSRIYLLHAPLYAPSKEVRDSLLNDPVNQVIRQMADKSDINIIGLSDLSLESNTLKCGTINERDYEELINLVSIGDLAGTFLDNNGNPLYWSKSDFNTGVTLSHISGAKHVICVAGELRKLEILRKISGKKYFSILFTTKAIAAELVKESFQKE
jgi:DNA-binding transcriptional regulator LsrR (DeoR family)